ncbi:MAG: lipopolysaccharide heptosyltransferase II [Candidatus Omnitrophota bacterium]
MNILQVVPQLNFGGVETGTVDLARELKKRGHKPVVVSGGGKLVKELENLGIKHYCLPVHKKSLINIIRQISKVAEIIQKEDIDIVHARSRVPGWISYFAARKTKRVFITTAHGYYSNHFFSRIMAQGKFVIVASQIIGRHMINDFNVAPERICLIERGVNLERFVFKPISDRSKTEFIIANIARLTPIKGHEYFLKAIAKLIRTLPHIQVWIIGDSPNESYLQQLEILSRRLGLSHCVKFMGQRQDIPQILMKVNLLVLTTVTQEAFGRVIIEAQASGAPVIATKVGGVVEIIEDGLTGILVAPKDPQALADAIIRVLKNPKLAQMLADNAYKKIKDFYTLEKMVDKNLEVYKQAKDSQRILIIKLSALGDILLITPSLRAIREKFKQAKISCITSLAGSQILQNCPSLDELIIYDYKGADSRPAAIIKVGAKLRSKAFDEVIDFQNSNRSHLLAFLSLARLRLGYDNGKLSFLLNKKTKDDGSVLGPVEHQAKMLKPLGLEIKSDELEIWPTQADENYANGLLKSYWLEGSVPVVGIHIGASSLWPTKLWPNRLVASAIDELSKENIRIVIMGGTADEKRAEEILSLTKSRPVNLCAKTTILQLAAVIRRCNCILTYDSLAMHIAAAVNVPFVALFGPTNVQRHIPPAKKYITIRKDLTCSPCYKRKCKFNNKCMQEISPKEVVAALKNLL